MNISETWPLLAVALLIWAGVWVFMMTVDRRVRALERQVNVPANALGDAAKENR